MLILKPKKEKNIPNIEISEKTEIEKVVEALENQEVRRPMTTFEEEQEANAIISYQELVQAVNAKKSQMEKETKEEKENIVKEPVLENNLEVEIDKESDKKFKNSEFISPIFGKDSNKTNEDFLNNLKDFRSNL